MPMIGGHENNLKLVSYPENKVRQLASLAATLGVLIHIEGIPFGAMSPQELQADYTPSVERAES